MAVMRHSIIFGGVDSADYGIYIGGEGVFNAPKREVEMIEIPGRNGAFALDKGRFENITVEYTAINHEPDLSTFSANLEAFRNALSAQKGYQRLEDTFHPDEYRMAVFREGLEIEPIEYNTASEFKIKFDCKPQRFLTSGETAVTVSSGDTLTNPTLFEASPLLEVEGYGNIDINGFDVSIENVVFGDIQVSEKVQNSAKLDITNCNSGDLLYTKVQGSVGALMGREEVKITGKLGAKVQGQTSTGSALRYYGPYYVGTPWSETWVSSTLNVTVIYGGETYSAEVTISPTMTYDGDDTISIGVATTKTGDGADYIDVAVTAEVYPFWCNSTKTILGHPTCVDCDLGEAYKVENDEIISLNAYIALGSKLPILSVGESEITYDNTITDLKVVPRWWKI